MKIKRCDLHDGVVSLVAINAMLKRAQLHKMGEFVRVYALDALGNPAEIWHRDSKTAQPLTKFHEWGIEFENGIVCSAVETPKNPDGPVASSYIFAGRARPFGMEGAIREGWGKPTLRHAIGYLDERYGSQEADAIAVLKDRAGLIPENPPDRPAPW